MAIRINGKLVSRDPVTGILTGPGTGKSAGKAIQKGQAKAVKQSGIGPMGPPMPRTNRLVADAPPPGSGTIQTGPPGSDGSMGASVCRTIFEPGWKRDLCVWGAKRIFGSTGEPTGGGSGTPTQNIQQQQAGGGQDQSCPPGMIRLPGLGCMGRQEGNGGAVTTQAGGAAVQGSFGMPAIQPTVESRTHRSCPDGMVLGKDNLCYPKAILSRRSKFRKWRQPRRPMFTAGDLNAIRRAERLKKKARKIGKDLGLKVTKR